MCVYRDAEAVGRGEVSRFHHGRFRDDKSQISTWARKCGQWHGVVARKQTADARCAGRFSLPDRLAFHPVSAAPDIADVVIRSSVVDRARPAIAPRTRDRVRSRTDDCVVSSNDDARPAIRTTFNHDATTTASC